MVFRPPLVNVYAWNEVRIWCELYWDKTEDLFLQQLPVQFYQVDLEPPKPPQPKTLSDLLRETEEGQLKIAKDDYDPFAGRIGPPWYIYDVCELGLYDVINPTDYSWPNLDLDPWAAFALHHGIAPLQPFLLSLPQPHYSRDYEGEYDAIYYHDVVDSRPLSNKQILSRWEKYLKSVDLEIPWVTTPPSS